MLPWINELFRYKCYKLIDLILKLICQNHTTPTTPNLLKFSLPWGVSIHGKYSTGEGKGEKWMGKNMKNAPFFLYCPLSHSLSNAYNTDCHERVSSIGHGGTNSFSQIIHIKPTAELAVQLPVRPLVLCVWFVKMSSYHHVLYYCQWERGGDITTSTSMPVRLWHSSMTLYWRKNLMIQLL